MNTYDKDLAEIIKNRQTVEMQGKQYYVEPGTGSCDGCAFIKDKTCSQHAVRICTSNGGNVLVLAEPSK